MINMEAIPNFDIKSVIRSDIKFDISTKLTTWIGHQDHAQAGKFGEKSIEIFIGPDATHSANILGTKFRRQNISEKFLQQSLIDKILSTKYWQQNLGKKNLSTISRLQNLGKFV